MDSPPSTARAQVQYCVHALRTEFGRLKVPASIVTQSPGYRVEVPDQRIDARRFEHLVTDGRGRARSGDLNGAIATLQQALDLWRGPTLDGCPRGVRDQLTWLEEMRLEVLEECLGHVLELGRHREVIGQLRTLVLENPLKEGLRYLLMLALYRSGRPSDALDVYRAGRGVMVEEYGLDPGDKLKRLEAAILAEDQSLLWKGPDTAAVAAVTTTAPSTTSWGRPRQLPSAIADFTGRDELVEEVERLLGGDDGAAPLNAVPIVNICGKAGVGKSALAVHVAHRVAAKNYPDGQLYVNLRSNAGHAVSAHDVLGRFLRALGVSGASIPDHEDERAEMYRGLLADRRVLIVLEDAATESQIAPALPGSASCGVVVTSRARLTGLVGSRLVPVDVLGRDQALLLLGHTLGMSRIEREPQAATALVAAVGGLPLALRIIGARLAARPHWTLASMLRRLADERGRLDELVHGDLVVRGSLQLSYAGLDGGAADLMGLLGALDAEDLPSWTAAAVLDDRAGTQSGETLDRLVDAQLLDCAVSGAPAAPRYSFHDLIRIFARERLRERPTEAESGALQRVLGGWLHLAEQAHRGLYGGDFTTLHGSGPRWPVPGPPVTGGADSPLRWLETERANICSAIEQGADAGLDELCWDLAVTLVSLFEVRSYFDDWQTTHEHALRATRVASNTRGTAAVLCSLGSLHINQSRLDLARSVLMPSFEAFAELGDEHGLALVRRNLGLLDRKAGSLSTAATHCAAALNGFIAVGDVVGQAAVLSQLAQLELDTQNHTRALALLQRAARTCALVSSPRVESQIRYKLGKALMAQGEYEAAAEVMSDVLNLVRATSDLQGESYATHAMGVVQKHRGELNLAAQLLEKAVRLCEQNVDRVNAAQSRLELACVESMRGRHTIAESLTDEANAILREYQIQDWTGRVPGGS
ncbi:AfsR/SARP family transcriptional regulator [Lentzea tibetensis]|nr:BTAD domain-containing putative transcriptional regulator [Lentzea tibetensis]